MAIQFNKSTAAENQDHLSREGKSSQKETGAVDSDAGNEGLRKDSLTRDLKSPIPASSFINTTNTGLKVKMPDSVHIFLPGETIEFIEKDLGTDGAQKELDRRARRHALKSKASVEWKRNKGKK